MKIVQINTVCGTGSTGKIAVSLYQISKENGHSPYFAFGRSTSPANISSYKIGNTFDFFHHVLVNFFLGKSGFASKSVTRKFLNWLDTVQPDLLHLHNIHGFYLHVGMLFDYIKAHNIPVVWTLHDCWPLTGQCAHFDYAGCDKWKTGCYQCPIYNKDYPYSIFRDNCINNYKAKKYAFTGVKNMILVTPSKWLADIVSSSYLKEYPIKIIPNGIDLNIFKPPTYENQKENIILGIANVWNKKKGLDIFLELANLLDDSYHITLIGLNRRQQSFIKKKYANRITALARTSSQIELAEWYQRALVYVNPTLEDNFPTTNLEALACGTPVITFNTGGSPECITEKCGIIVPKENVCRLKEAIYSIRNHSLITAESCRSQALNYDKNHRFLEYLKIYNSIAEVR